MKQQIIFLLLSSAAAYGSFNIHSSENEQLLQNDYLVTQKKKIAQKRCCSVSALIFLYSFNLLLAAGTGFFLIVPCQDSSVRPLTDRFNNTEFQEKFDYKK